MTTVGTITEFSVPTAFVETSASKVGRMRP
jgi:hypothetical protein